MAKNVLNKSDLVTDQSLLENFTSENTNIMHVDNVTYIVSFTDATDAYGTFNVQVTQAKPGTPEATWHWTTLPVTDLLTGEILTDIPVATPFEDIVISPLFANFSNIRLDYTAGGGSDGYCNISINAKSLS